MSQLKEGCTDFAKNLGVASKFLGAEKVARSRVLIEDSQY